MTKENKRKMMKRRVDSLAATQTAGRIKLGQVCWWTVEKDLNVAGTTAIQAFKDKGFPDAELPVPLDSEVAFGRAVKKISQRMAGWRIKEAFRGEDKIIYRITRETVDEAAADVNYNKEDRITLNRKTNDIVIERGSEPAKAIRDQYKNTVGRVDNWRLIDLLLKQIRITGSLQLRDGGGIYFIPAKHEDKVSLIEQAMAEIAPASVLYLLPIYDDTKAQNSLKSAFNEEFKKELERMTTELEERIEAGNTRASTFQNRMAEYKALRERAKAYEDLLNFKAKDIHDAISKLEEQVVDALANSTEE